MKSYRKLLFVIPVTLILLVSPGCKKFLQKDLQGQLTQQSFPTSAADALMATNASYEILRDWYYNSGGYPILDIMSDDARKGSNPDDQSNYVGPYDVFTFSSSQDGLDRWWNTLYVGAKRANVVIQYVPDIEMDDVLRTRYVAEATFIRGLLYLDFMRAWGGVPLVTISKSSTAHDQGIKRGGLCLDHCGFAICGKSSSYAKRISCFRYGKGNQRGCAGFTGQGLSFYERLCQCRKICARM